MRASWIAAATAVVGLALVWLAVARRDEASTATPLAPLTPRAAIDAPAQDAQPVPAVAHAEREAVAVERELLAPTGADALVLRVIDADTRAPQPGAVVWIAALEDWIEVIDVEPSADSPDPELALRELGQRGVADDAGELRVVVAEEARVAGARHADRFGFAQIPGRDEGGAEVVELELQPDYALEVRVVDGAGEPVGGVPLIARSDQAQFWRGTTRANDGVAVIHHAQEMFRDWWKEASIEVGFDLPLDDDAARVSFTRETIPTEPIELMLPPTGSVVVVVEHAGAMGSGHFELVVLEPGSDAEVLPPGRPTFEAPIVNGVARFPHVGLGLALGARLHAREREPSEHFGAGPSIVGEELRWTVRTGGELAVVIGQAVDARGAALARTKLEAQVHERDADYGHHFDLATDDEGRFRLALLDVDTEPALALDLRRFAGASSVAESFVSIDLPHPLPPGERDIGRVMITELPLLVAGVVQDESGRPVEWATVSLMRSSSRDAGKEPIWVSSGLETHTDEAGRFEFFARSDGGGHLVRATSMEFVEDPGTTFEPGRRALVIVLRRGGGITGNVRIEERPRAACFVIASSDTGATRANFLEEHGRFTVEPLAPGTYTVAVAVGNGEELHRVLKVQVLDGRRHADPRLADIDLIGKLHAHVIRVVDAGGAAVPGARIQFRRTGDADAEWRRSDVPFGERELSLITTHATIDLVVHAPGFRSVSHSAIPGAVEVLLRPALSVRVHPPAGIVLPPGSTVRVHLERPYSSSSMDGSPIDARTADVVVDARHGVVLEVPAPGEWEVAVQITWKEPGGRERSRDLSPDDGWQTVHVADVPTEQSFVLDIDREALEDAAKLMR